MAGREPEVTVVIPTRDRWALVERAVQSALGQTGVALEVVVVDDGSQSRAPDLPEQVRLERLSPGAGVAAARNAGLTVARGEWVAFLDDDDLWAPPRLSRLIAAAVADGALFAYSDAVLVGPDLDVLQHQPGPAPSGLVEALKARNAIPGGGSGVVASASLVRERGGFDERFSYLADWELWWRLAQTAPAAHVAEALLAYAVHMGGWALGGDPAIGGDLARLRAKHPEIRPDPGEYAAHVAYRLHLAGRRGDAAVRYLSAAARHRRPRLAAAAARAIVGRRAAVALRAERRPPHPPTWLAPGS